MKTMAPFLRLALITSAVLTLVFFGVISLRLVALSAPPQLAMLPKVSVKPVIFGLGDKDFGDPISLKAYEATTRLGEQVVPTIQVRPTPEQEWVLFQPSHPEATEGLMFLTEFLTKFNPKTLMVIVHTREVAGATSLVNLLGEREDPLVTYIYSPNHRVNREFRKRRPLWLRGGDASGLAQWHVFAALWLEPMVATDFDWFLRGGPHGHQSDFAPRVREELARRQVGEILFLETGDEPIGNFLYGVLTDRPTAVLTRLNSPK